MCEEIFSILSADYSDFELLADNQLLHHGYIPQNSVLILVPQKKEPDKSLILAQLIEMAGDKFDPKMLEDAANNCNSVESAIDLLFSGWKTVDTKKRPAQSPTPEIQNIELLIEKRNAALEKIRTSHHGPAKEYIPICSHYMNQASELNSEIKQLEAKRAVQSSQGQQNSDWNLDLHGYNSNEAIAIVMDWLINWKLSKAPNLTIIVGRGTHSKGPLRLGPVVLKILQEQNLKFDNFIRENGTILVKR